MLLLKSLFCLRGCDNPSRFLLINLSVYVALLLLGALLANTPALLFITTTLLLIITTTNGIRRVRDIELNQAWATAPLVGFILCAGGVTFFDAGSRFWVLFLPAIITAALAFRPGTQNLAYILGYSGPVDLSALKHSEITASQYANRVEPTLDSDKPLPLQSSVEDAYPEQSTESFTSPLAFKFHVSLTWLTPVTHWLLDNRNKSLAVTGLLILVVIGIATLPLLSDVPDAPIKLTEPVIVQPKRLRQHTLEMPNNYSLMQNEHLGVIIHWPSYDNQNDSLWSILTAKGEQTCQAMVFNDSLSIRTNLVSIEGDGDYYASFSPLDSEVLINAIANKNNFSLCGYQFSLKGSRVALNRSVAFSEYL